MQATFLGHSTFEVETAEHTLLIDPFFDDNPMNPRSVADASPDYILVTHGHFDHVGETKEIAERTGAGVVAIPEILGSLGEGIEGHQINIGGVIDLPFGTVQMFQGFHSGTVPGSTVGGYIIKSGGRTFYHAGDTGLFSDMKLLNGVLVDHIDLAVLPIGSTFTMDIHGAAIAAEYIEPSRVVPCHYNTWPPVEADAEAFRRKVQERNSSIEVVIPDPGESVDV